MASSAGCSDLQRVLVLLALEVCSLPVLRPLNDGVWLDVYALGRVPARQHHEGQHSAWAQHAKGIT